MHIDQNNLQLFLEIVGGMLFAGWFLRNIFRIIGFIVICIIGIACFGNFPS